MVAGDNNNHAEHFYSIDRSNSQFTQASKSDIAYLLETKQSFLQIVAVIDDSIDPATLSEIDQKLDDGYYGYPALLELDSGWIAHYWPASSEYPAAMCISAAANVVAPLASNGHGTLVAQAFDAAAQLVLLALSHKWSAIQIVGGSRLMQWAAWAVAEYHNLPCYGYEADASGRAKAERIQEIIADKYQLQASNTPAPKAGSTTDSGSDVEKDN